MLLRTLAAIGWLLLAAFPAPAAESADRCLESAAALAR